MRQGGERCLYFERHVAAAGSIAVLPVCDQNRGCIVAEDAKFLSGERAQDIEGDDTCFYAVFSQTVDGFHGGVVGGTEHKEQHLGILVPVGTTERELASREGSVFCK